MWSNFMPQPWTKMTSEFTEVPCSIMSPIIGQKFRIYVSKWKINIEEIYFLLLYLREGLRQMGNRICRIPYVFIFFPLHSLWAHWVRLSPHPLPSFLHLLSLRVANCQCLRMDGHLRLQSFLGFVFLVVFFFALPLKIFFSFLFDFWQLSLNIHGWVLHVFHIPDLSPHSGHWHMFPATFIYSLCSIIWHWVSFVFDRFPGCSCWKRGLYLKCAFGLLSSCSFPQPPWRPTQPWAHANFLQN